MCHHSCTEDNREQTRSTCQDNLNEKANVNKSKGEPTEFTCWTNTNFVSITLSIATLLVALWIWSAHCTLFLQLQTDGRARQHSIRVHVSDSQLENESGHSGYVAHARDEHLKHFGRFGNLPLLTYGYDRIVENVVVERIESIEVVVIVLLP